MYLSKDFRLYLTVNDLAKIWGLPIRRVSSFIDGEPALLRVAVPVSNRNETTFRPKSAHSL
jgi:hypothetical protein